MEATTIYLSLFTGAVLLVWFIYKQMSGPKETWEQYGVPHASDFSPRDFMDFRNTFFRLFDKYGDNVGIKRMNLQLVTRDLNIIKQVMVKDFNNFVNRNLFLQTKSNVKKGLFFASDNHWRRLRHISSPSFSTGKLKLIANDVETSAEKLSEVLLQTAKKGELVEIKTRAAQYTSRIIARTAFGLNSDCIGEEDDQFTKFSRRLFKIRGKFARIFLTVLLIYPKLLKFLVEKVRIRYLDGVNEDSSNYFESIIRQAIKERRENIHQGLKQHKDFLQQLILANDDSENGKIVDRVEDKKENTQAKSESQNENITQAKSLSETKITDEDIIGQSIIVIFAGFETTATTLQMILFLLAKHQDIQEKVLQEINDVVTTEKPNYEDLGRLKYAEQVINETLRLYPPAPIMSRMAYEERKYGDITIPKGSSILLPLFVVLKDPKHWPEPEKFDPDRFTEENKSKRDPIAFIPFGHGPRQCIGMRLAYLELKLALVYILRKVRFELSDRTEPLLGGDDIKFLSQGLLIPEKPILLEVRPRE